MDDKAFALLTTLLTVLACCWLLGCTPVMRVGIEPFYENEPVSASAVEVLQNISYVDGPAADPDKQCLDFYRPLQPGPYPLLVFVHGGSLTRGDKDKRVGGRDIYGNIGRFYANRGVGVVVADYRLQPQVSWRQQAMDVAQAISWSQRRASQMGAKPGVVLSGHSAGAWLVARAVFDRQLQHSAGVDADRIDGVVLVSGSGFEMTDDETWRLYGQPKKYAWWSERFASEVPGQDWRSAASIVPLVRGNAPPFLLLHTRKDLRALARQNQLLFQALIDNGIDAELVELDQGTHRRIVLALSHPQREASKRVLEFVAPLTTPEATSAGSR